MLDHALTHHRRTPVGVGEVDQSRSAGRLFAGDYSTSTTAGEEFGDSRLGLGVMHDLDGEVVSIQGKTWRIPVDGIPIKVLPDEGLAFGVAAHGGRPHLLPLAPACDVDGILQAVDDYLKATHVNHEMVVCAVEISGDFEDVILRTVAAPTHEGETLGEVIDSETRFTFDSWQGTLVGFRFPDHTTGETIPGLHLHGLSHDATNGGHVRDAVTRNVTAMIWVDEFHQLHDEPVEVSENSGREGAATIDFHRYEGKPT